MQPITNSPASSNTDTPGASERIRERKRKPRHFASARVTDNSGKTLYDYQIESDNQTSQEKALERRKSR